MKMQGRPSDSGQFLTAIHLQNQVMMRRRAIAIVTATTSLTMLELRMIGGHVVLSGSDCLHLTMAQHNGSTRTIFSIGFPASVNYASSPISTIPGHIPSF